MVPANERLVKSSATRKSSQDIILQALTSDFGVKAATYANTGRTTQMAHQLYAKSQLKYELLPW
jgi:hypothetical protein